MAGRRTKRRLCASIGSGSGATNIAKQRNKQSTLIYKLSCGSGATEHGQPPQHKALLVSGNFIQTLNMDTTIHSKSKARFILKAFMFCAVFTGLFFILSSTLNFAPPGFERLTQGTIGTIAALLTTFLFLKIDKKRFSDIGLRFEGKTIVKFFAGVFIGILIMGVLAMSVAYISNMQIYVNPRSSVLNFLLVTAPLIPLALMEELGFRAYPLQLLKDKTGLRLAIIITSVLFALYHVASGWSVASSFYGPAVWGLVFGLAAIYSKGIALPTGIHYAANLTTSAFGEANSLVSIWTVKASTATAQKGVDWATLFPVFALLAFAIVCIELYVRQKTAANN